MNRFANIKNINNLIKRETKRKTVIKKEIKIKIRDKIIKAWDIHSLIEKDW